MTAQFWFGRHFSRLETYGIMLILWTAMSAQSLWPFVAAIPLLAVSYWAERTLP